MNNMKRKTRNVENVGKCSVAVYNIIILGSGWEKYICAYYLVNLQNRQLELRFYCLNINSRLFLDYFWHYNLWHHVASELTFLWMSLQFHIRLFLLGQSKSQYNIMALKIDLRTKCLPSIPYPRLSPRKEQ